MSIKKILERYKQVLSYIVFGVLTTIVNVIVYWFMAHQLMIETVPSSVIAWVAAVAFAYVTNRKWVFYSDKHTSIEVAKEALWFFFCRLSTGILDWGYMLVTVDILRWNDVWMKLIANAIVIVLNFIASKLLIFKKGKNTNEKI